MHQNTLTSCVIVLAFVVGFSLGREFVGVSHRPVAEGQAKDGSVLMAASNTQNDSFCFLYDPSTKQLASYKQRTVGGLELKGIRTCSADFNPKILEYPTSTSKTAVRNMKDLAENPSGRKKR